MKRAATMVLELRRAAPLPPPTATADMRRGARLR
jgi:hypothetical protein